MDRLQHLIVHKSVQAQHPIINQSETVRKYEFAPLGRLAGLTATPNFINQFETVSNCNTPLCNRALKLHTKSFHLSNKHKEHVYEGHGETEKKVYE